MSARAKTSVAKQRHSRFTRRNIELALLVLAALPAFLIFALVAMGTGETVELTTFNYPIAILIIFLIAHIVTRIYAEGADPVPLVIAYILFNIGIAFLVRLAPDVLAYQIANGVKEPTITPESVFKQCIYLIAGIVFLVAVLVATHKKFKIEQLTGYWVVFMVVAIVLLASPILLGSTASNGALNEIRIGPFSLMPGEFAKLFMVLGLASYMSQNREMLSIFTVQKGPVHLPDLRTLAPMLIMWAIAMLIIAFERDFGTAFVLFTVFLAMLYVATGKKFYAIVGILFVILGIAVLSNFVGHIQTRIDNWLDPFADPQGAGYQMVQSLYSLADGGIFGVGAGHGLSYWVPAIENDYIFTAIAEETGLFGGACVLMLYLSFAIRGFLTAARAKTDFACLVAVGMTSVIVFQAFIIVAGITRVIPLTGITLPFVCRGGSSIIASFIALAFIMRCGDEGTGVKTRMISFFDSLDKKNVLGRYALGKRLTHMVVVLSVLYAVLICSLITIMFIQAPEYQEMPGNNHTMVHQANVKRGTISTSDGVILAQSVESDEDPYSMYVREYPQGDLASQVVGYYSRQYGTSGIEDAYNNSLEGRTSNSFISSIDQLLGNTGAGNDVVLTIDSRIQRAAQDALSGEVGACVVLDARSGNVLAMASSPTYNAGEFAAVLEAAANGSDESSMVNRATQSRYAPGSTFKTITLATALEQGIATPDTLLEAPGEMAIGEKPVVNYNHEELGTLTLAQAYAYSSNTAFAQLGLMIGSEKLVKGADAFYFDSELDFDLPIATSRMASAEGMDEWELAWAAVGQPVGKSTANGPYATVLEMALVGSAIANDGSIVQPHIVDGVYSPEGIRTAGTLMPTVISWACSPATASQVEEMMRGVVEYGTGSNAAIEGRVVYGKTGTAETSRSADDSWFVGYVDCGDSSIVIAMVLEEASVRGDGMNAAAHCKPVLETALAVKEQ